MSDALMVSGYVVVSAAVAVGWVWYMVGFRLADGIDYGFGALMGALWPVSIIVLLFAVLLSAASGDLL